MTKYDIKVHDYEGTIDPFYSELKIEAVQNGIFDMNAAALDG